MIARIFAALLLLIIVPDAYIYMCLRRRKGVSKWTKAVFWLPASLLCVYTLALTASRNFAPNSIMALNVYLLLLGVVIIPKAVFAVCHFLGWAHCRYHHTQTNYGVHAGAALAAIIIMMTVYGCTLGFSKVVVRHETFYSPDLPTGFDGYRIAHLSDIHAGTFSGRLINILEREVDSVNAQKPDLIVFTGDIQNMRPSELVPATNALRRLKATDGKVSILGNHDYAEYIDAPEDVKRANEKELRDRERGFGWTLLLNSNLAIKRGEDSIFIAGMENDGQPPFPQKGDLRRAMAGIGSHSFVVMLEHDPTAWRRKILPSSQAQLTLSGHTHAMQFELFGWSPSSLVYKEWGGIFFEGERAINVSKGMGGFIPFRIGASNEIVIITLRRGVAP